MKYLIALSMFVSSYTSISKIYKAEQLLVKQCLEDITITPVFSFPVKYLLNKGNIPIFSLAIAVKIRRNRYSHYYNSV